MENQEIQKSQQNLPLLNDRLTKIGKLVYQMNLLAPYPLSDQSIIEWSKCIDELMPDLKLETLKEAIDNMKLGKLEYDKNLGIQNIFLAIRSLERPMVY